MRFRLRQDEGETQRKLLICRDWKGSLCRHHPIYCLMYQCLTKGMLRQIRLYSSVLRWGKAGRGQQHLGYQGVF